MPTVKNLGHLSLAIAAGGFVGLEVSLHQGWLAHPAWRVLAGGFEAGTVGALADWYAVTALFRRVPVPVLGRHSDIIVRNRGKIIANIARTVETEWLTPAAIGEQFSRLSVVGGVLEYLDQPDHREQVATFLRDLAGRVAEQLDRPELVEFLRELLRKQLTHAPVARSVGQFVQRWIESGDHRGMWDVLLGSLEANLCSAEVRRVVGRMIRDAVVTYVPTLLKQADRPELTAAIERAIKGKLDGWEIAPPVGRVIERVVESRGHDALLDLLVSNVRRTLGRDPAIREKLKETLGGAISRYQRRHLVKGVLVNLLLERDSAVDSFLAALDRTLEEVERDHRHEIRQRLDAMLLDFARRAADGDPELVAAMANLKQRVIDQTDWPRLIRGVLDWTTGTVREELESPSPKLRLIDYEALTDVVVNAAGGVVADVRADDGHPIRRKLDDVLRAFGSRLADEDPVVTAVIDRLKQQVIDQPALGEMIAAVLRGVRSTVAQQLATRDAALSRLLGQALDSLLSNLRDDAALRSRLDAWVRETVSGLVARHHHLIGDMVRASMEKLSPREMVATIEQKVGDDLQFIRLNGAVVGFGVGIVLSLLRYAMT